MSKRRSRARERKEAREAQQKRQRQLTIIGVVVVVAIIGAVLFVTSSQPVQAPVPDGLLDRYDNYITGTDEDGFPQIGNPNAPVKVVEYSSFTCPACVQFHDTIFPRLLPYIERGEVRFVFVPLQTGSIRNAEGAARTGVCALRQDRFWEMHDLLFDWHSTFANSAFDSSRLSAAVDALNMDSGQFNECFNSTATGDLLVLAQRQGVAATPTVRVNGNTLPSATFEAIESAINQFTMPDDLEPGVIGDTDDSTDTDDSDDEAPADTSDEATQEATAEVTEEMTSEATEEMTDEATEEATDEATDNTDDS
jgi:protein-disulfide isomerase